MNSLLENIEREIQYTGKKQEKNKPLWGQYWATIEIVLDFVLKNVLVKFINNKEKNIAI